MPDRYSDPGALFLIDKDYVSIDDFRPIFSQDLAVTGDAQSKQIIWETTLKVGNPLAHYCIDALTNRATLEVRTLILPTRLLLA